MNNKRFTMTFVSPAIVCSCGLATLACLLIGCSTSTKVASGPHPSTIAGRIQRVPEDFSIQKVYPLPFVASNWLACSGFEGDIGDPVEAFQHFYVKSNNHVVRISKPGDLADLGAITIRSEAQALSFVQLFTSPKTFFMFSSPDALDVRVVDPAGRKVQAGALSAELYAQLGLAPARVTVTSDGYLITRFVVGCASISIGFSNREGHEILRLQEHVTGKGRYEVLSSTVQGQVSSEDVWIPVFI